MSIFQSGLFGSDSASQAANPLLMPTSSALFTSASSESLTISHNNWGNYNRAKWAISVWWRSATNNVAHTILSKQAGATNSGAEWRLVINSSNQLQWITVVGGSIDGRQDSTASLFADTNWHHIMIHFDADNSTVGDRMKSWVDGVEITSFGVDTNPTEAVSTEIGAAVSIGSQGNAGGFANGRVFQPTFFSGRLPSIAEVYSSGSAQPMGILDTGVHSLNNPNAGITSDAILAAAWTDNNTVTISTDIPT